MSGHVISHWREPRAGDRAVTPILRYTYDSEKEYASRLRDEGNRIAARGLDILASDGV